MPQVTASFEVILIRKVPYLTALLFNLASVCFLTLLFIKIFFLPSLGSSPEMKTAYFIVVIPEFIKNAMLISGLALIIITPLYFASKRHGTASVIFYADQFIIAGQKFNYTIPLNSIKRIFCMDPKNAEGNPRDRLFLYIERNKDTEIRIRLKYYEQADAFMNCLEQYKNINLLFYDFNFDPVIDPEEKE